MTTPSLFACGTLRRSEVNPYAADLHAHSAYAGRARLRGRLYSLGRYPGMVLSDDPADVVHGDVFTLTPQHAAEVLARMDEYEGPQFERRGVEVVLEGGEAVRCWAYLYRGDVEGCGRVASGDWLAHRAESGGNN